MVAPKFRDLLFQNNFRLIFSLIHAPPGLPIHFFCACKKIFAQIAGKPDPCRRQLFTSLTVSNLDKSVQSIERFDSKKSVPIRIDISMLQSMIDTFLPGGEMEGNPDPLIYHENEHIAFIEINRPEKKNALNGECWQLFDEHFEKLKSNNNVRALVISGRAEDVFSAGFDVTPTETFISDMLHALESRDKAKLVQGFADIQRVLSKLSHLPFPTVAAINGLCYSGAVELAVACDIRVVKAGAVISLQETRLGLIPDLGGTVRLARLIGPARAKDLIFTARQILPEEAKDLGLVNHIFPQKDFQSHVIDYVKRITANAPAALRAVKEIIELTLTMEAVEALAFEREKAAENILSRQCIEGISAFLEKRPPKW
jgi:enoyl-CoA hydratase/carnithine racemase